MLLPCLATESELCGTGSQQVGVRLGVSAPPRLAYFPYESMSVGTKRAEGTITLTDFDRSVKHISTRTDYAHHIATPTLPGFSDLPTALMNHSSSLRLWHVKLMYEADSLTSPGPRT